MHDQREMRKININENHSKIFCDNKIKTAKYNKWTFFPLAIAYQFKNYFNIFFLFTALILSIDIISPMDPGVAIGPFIFVIMVSVIREGIEDYKKAKYDKTYNNSKTIKINTNGKEEEIIWGKVTVGSIIKIKKNEVIPADVLVIKSSNENGFCYLQTTNLDGESALKPREAHYVFSTIENFFDIKGYIEVEQPNFNIYSISGIININETERHHFNIDNVILRGGTLKNVDFIYGLVIYTGKDTKIMKNIQNSSLKTSSIEKTLNKVIIPVIIMVMSASAACTVFGMIYMSTNVPDYSKEEKKSEYIYYEKDNSQPYALEFFQLFAAYFILFNNIIPISLTITFEIAKGIQVMYMERDKELGKAYDENFKILSLKLQEDLGNVKYFFTDKTGTLTKNEMEFKACSIFTKIFEEDLLDNVIKLSKVSNLAKSIFSINFDYSLLINALENDNPLNLLEEHGVIKSLQEAALEFFLNIALNQNVLKEIDKEGFVNFQGPNPDEVALVQAAYELGIEFVERVGKIITLKIKDEIIHYEIMQRFDFTSLRARSSIIVKDIKTNKLKMYMKGADNVILKQIDLFSKNNILPSTKEHIEKFAKCGLRTLCYSYKNLSLEEYLEWENKYKQIKYTSLINKDEKELDLIIKELESNMILLGVSGLEDKLQDNVKNVIQELIEADIHIWMLTGDKLDTAESIGYSSRLFNDDTEVFKIKSNESKEDILNKLNDIKSQMFDYEKQVQNLKLERKKKRNSKFVMKEDDKDIKEHSNNSPIKNENQFNYEVSESNGKQNLSYKKNNINSINANTNTATKTNNLNIDNLQEYEVAINHSFNDKIKKKKIHLNDNINTSIDDISVIRFMVDKKFFEANSGRRQNDNMTFLKKILVKPNNMDGENEVYPLKDQMSPDKNINNIEDVNVNLDTDHVDLSVLYEYYRRELIRMEEKKKNVKNILKYTNFNFKDIKKRNPEEEINKENSLMNFGLIIEGDAISTCLEPDVSHIFWKLIKKTNSIICCRCNPIQKSDIVHFVKNKSGEVCLAIGDGGNDVNMIKTANVGVGIFGKEGYQAAYSADYAISQFQYIRRLIFYHGRYSLLRNSYFIYFFFYKSLIYCIPNLWFAFFCGFSGTNFWDNIYFILYTSIISTVPPVVLMVYEQDIDIDFNEYDNKDVLNCLVPDIYREYRDTSPFNSLKFFIIFLLGILHSAFIFFFPLIVYRLSMQDFTGRSHSMWDHSLLSNLTVLIVQYYIILQDTFYFSFEVILAHGIQILHNFIFVFIYGATNSDQLGAYTYDIISNIQFWFSLMIMLAISLIPIIISRKLDILFSHNLINNIRNRRFEDDYLRKKYIKKLENMSRCTRSLAKFKKIYKINNEYVAENYADKKMKEFVELYKTLKRVQSEDIDKFNENILRKCKSMEVKKLWKMKKEIDNDLSDDDKDNDNIEKNINKMIMRSEFNCVNKSNKNPFDEKKSNLKRNFNYIVEEEKKEYTCQSAIKEKDSSFINVKKVVFKSDKIEDEDR